MTAQLPSKVRLAQIASFSKSMALPPSHDEIEAMARALLAAHEQEPVMEIRSHFNGEYVCRKLTKGTLKPGVKLYTHRAPVPAVPDECPKCNGTGMMDSGGVQPWGEPIQVVCDCRYEVPTTTPAVPEGYVLVPVKPTKDMLAAAEYDRGADWQYAVDIWDSMCRAAMLSGGKS